MDVTTMQSTSSLAHKLSDDYPQFSFKVDDSFRWNPVNKIIFYRESEDLPSLLHELSHALLGHTTYQKDIELLGMERDAWNHAVTVLSPKYEVEINDDDLQNALNTYRDWLHSRSLCPNCSASGVQSHINTYKCIACGTAWKVNEARICHLRRYVIAKKHTL